MKERTYTDIHVGQRVLRDWSDGEQEDVTPICIHRTKGNGGECSTKCKVSARVVYCSGRAVDCGSYSNGRRLKTLFD